MKKNNFFTHKFLPVLGFTLLILNIVLVNISHGTNEVMPYSNNTIVTNELLTTTVPRRDNRNISTYSLNNNGVNVGGSMCELKGNILTYDFYSCKGHQQGEIVLTDEMISSPSTVIFYNDCANMFFCVDLADIYGSSFPYGHIYFKYHIDVDTWRIGYDSPEHWCNTIYRQYNSSTKTWTDKINTSWVVGGDGRGFRGIDSLPINGVVYTSSVYVHFISQQDNCFDFSYPRSAYYPTFPFIDNPNDFIMGNSEYLDIDLRDFYNWGTITSEFHDAVLNSEFYLYGSFYIVCEDTTTIVFSEDICSDTYLKEFDNGYHLLIPKSDIEELNPNYKYKILLNCTLRNKIWYENAPNLEFVTNVPLEDYCLLEFTPNIPVEVPEDPTIGAIGNMTNSINDQTQAIKENTETSKGIFAQIGELLSYINPFSENFFVYKLIELLIEAIKGLFIPSNDFFSTYFDELSKWFSDRLGFLYYPIELFFDLCDRFLNINFNDPIINIPDIKAPFTDTTLISATTFNFNSLLEQSSLKTAHNIYLILVDAVVYIGLVMLLYKKYEEVMTK